MLDGKVATVTGVTSGLGRAVAKVSAAAGARVLGTGRRAELGRELEKEIADAGGTMAFVPADVRIVAECERLITATVDRFGGLDVLVNNAATRSDPALLALEQVDEANWDNVLDSNLKSAFFVTRYAIPAMRVRGGGLVLNISSFLAEEAIAGMAPYAVSKAGLVQLTRMTAVEHGRDNIRAIAILLGGTDTGQAERTNAARSSFGLTEPQPDRSSAAVPPLMDTADVARALAVLCTDDAQLVTGASIAIDRGVTAGLLSSLWIHRGADAARR